jgi:hypothetical protein
VQLGTRWSVGGEPPSRLGDLMKSAIAASERGHESQTWTLTWLEGHPRAELDDGTVVREDYDGTVVVEAP